MAYFRRIAAGGEFEVAFQQIVDVGTRKLHHYEALVRFDGEVDSSPYEMIRLAENTGLIAEFDFAMCRKVLAWIGAAGALRRKVVAAVNVSGQSISDPLFVEKLRELLDAHPRVRKQLLFEITESAQVRDIEATNEAVQWLRRAGHKICLDDFGAGAAALRYLQSLDVDIVKIDGHYIRSAMTPGKNRAFLRAVVGLCRELGIATIAEMVEDEECLAVVRDSGIDLAQGYLFGRPTVVLKRNTADPGGRGVVRRAADG
jgi:EAL domain-containing protein (putative c-di-GMP-specific phosphodiesterase class I)